jgi:hypothetical protein
MTTLAQAAQRPDPQAALIDALSDEELIAALGPSWLKMTEGQRAAYGRATPEPDPLFVELEQFAARDDLLGDIEQDLRSILDRCEQKLIALEAKDLTKPVAPPPVADRPWWK